LVLREGKFVQHASPGHEQLALLHVDDSPHERYLVKHAIFLSETPLKYYGADRLETAMAFFQSHWKDSNPKSHPRPALVLLDYDLAEGTGADFLYWLRLMKKITSTPVVMFSGSVGETCVAQCYAIGATHFLSKPRSLARMKVIVRALYMSVQTSGARSGPIRLLEEYLPDPQGQVLKSTPA
jgi:CheY-like chemotaxis protein